MKTKKIILSLVDNFGVEWVNTETTKTKAIAIARAYANAGVTLTAKFKAVA